MGLVGHKSVMQTIHSLGKRRWAGTLAVAASWMIFAVSCGAQSAAASPPVSAPEKEVNLLFVGSSFLAGAGSQLELVQAMLVSKGWRVNASKCTSAGMGCVFAYAHNLGHMAASEKERLGKGQLTQETWNKTCGGRKGGLTKVIQSRPSWDYLILDTYGSIGAPDFEEALAGIAQQVRDHSPKCQIILYVVWGNPKRSPEERRASSKICYELAKKYHLWAAPCGLALMDGYNLRPELTFYRPKEAPNFFHSGYNGGYICASVLFAMITGSSPVGLPSTLKVHPTYMFPEEDVKDRPNPNSLLDFVTEPSVAQFLQELAWKTYQAELPAAKP